MAGRRPQVIIWNGHDTSRRLGAGSLLYTNVDVEGLQQGVRFEPVKHLIANVHIPVVVAGGISARTGYRRSAGCRGIRSSARFCPL